MSPKDLNIHLKMTHDSSFKIDVKDTKITKIPREA